MTTNHAEALTHYTDAIAAINSHIAALPRTEADKNALTEVLSEMDGHTETPQAFADCAIDIIQSISNSAPELLAPTFETLARCCALNALDW